MKILRNISLVLLFLFSILIFMPKQNLYFLLEKELKQYDVIISDEKFISTLFGFQLQNALVYVKGVNIATLNNVQISLSGINISSKEIGIVFSNINIQNRSIVLHFEPTRTFIKKYKIVLKYFQKQKRGVYQYEYKLF
jgi:hypothetical protein